MANRSRSMILVGGGLANALIAWRLAQTRPEVAVTIVEAGDRLGGNHTWSFHEFDVDADQAAWLEPFVVHRWEAQTVRFRGLSRRLTTGYRSVTSERLRDLVGALPGVSVRTGCRVAALDPGSVRLEDGTRLTADAVIDGRGQRRSRHLVLGFQKFLGLEVRTRGPHGIDEPVLMDATVPQIDGYRFLYLLPFGPDRVLVEDTRYSDDPRVDTAVFTKDIEAYVRSRGLVIEAVEREEVGCLPITLAGDIEGFLAEGTPGVPRVGLRAALFHPTTGYSLPEAVRLADLVATAPDISSDALDATILAHIRKVWHGQAFYRMLNRFLFCAARPEGRHLVMERFYGLPEGLFRRFYAGRSTTADKIRILVGRPPVPVTRALGCMSEGAFLRASLHAA